LVQVRGPVRKDTSAPSQSIEKLCALSVQIIFSIWSTYIGFCLSLDLSWRICRSLAGCEGYSQVCQYELLWRGNQGSVDELDDCNVMGCSVLAHSKGNSRYLKWQRKLGCTKRGGQVPHLVGGQGVKWMEQIVRSLGRGRNTTSENGLSGG